MIAKSFKITGDGARHTFSSAIAAIFGVTEPTTGFQCKWLQGITPPTNSASVLIGGNEVSSTVGFPIPVGWAGQMLPPISEESSRYNLNQEWYYAATGDVLYCLMGID